MAPLSATKKKLSLARAYLRGYPIWCTWQVTYACNYRCVGCSYWKEEVNFSRQARGREATLAEIRSGAAKLAELGSLLVSMAGGEPLLRLDIVEIVAAVHEHHFALLTTNGSLVTEQRARELWQAGLFGVSVSLDFKDDVAHDANRGRTGAAARAREALRIFSRTRPDRNRRVNLMCVLYDGNVDEVEELISFAGRHGCTFSVQPYVAAKNGNRQLLPPAGASSHLLRLRNRYPNFISTPQFLANFDRFANGSGIPGCRAGKSFFNVDNFGDVQKCVEFRAEPIGNLREMTVPELLRRLRDEHRRNRCQACWYSCRGEVESLYTLAGLRAALPLVRGSSGKQVLRGSVSSIQY